MKKRRIFGFLAGIASGLAAIAYAAVTVICIVRINDVTRIINDTTDNLSGMHLLAYASLTYVIAVLGIVLSTAFAGYRAALSYYYIKLAFSDDEFYAKRLGGTIGFLVLTAIMLAVYTVVREGFLDVLPEKVQIAVHVAFILYIVLLALPIADRIICALFKDKGGNNVGGEVNVTKEDIVAELDELSDKTVQKSEEITENTEKKEEVKPMEVKVGKNGGKGKGKNKRR